MTHTNNFEVAIPVQFLKPPFNGKKHYDYLFKVIVFYSCNSRGDNIEIFQQQSSFQGVKFINWDDVGLERHFIDAARNNWDSHNGIKEGEKLQLTQENELID